MDKNRYKYQHLAKVLFSKYENVSQISKAVGWDRNSINWLLEGKHAPRKDFIDCILQAADMTYEEAFVEDYA